MERARDQGERNPSKADQALSTMTRSQIPPGYCTVLISRYKFKVSLDALTENWHCLCPAVSMTSNQGSQLLAVILFIIAGPHNKQKRSPIVLGVVQKCLIGLFIGCSLELLLNKVFSNINKFKFQNSRNQFPEICSHKQLIQLCLCNFQLYTEHLILLFTSRKNCIIKSWCLGSK